ncbi:hypothetical protein A3K73_04165 [Candidatus Pacearchaeota archaeon RBG_13_36_9]|nr:MAG: hypothetical protein A3K73_04165 [Candidatus Pacearchaeota archaeon RBG_13_36_9]
MEFKSTNRDIAINYSIKIVISVFLLIIAYYALQMIIIKGNLLSVEPFLMSVFYVNCALVGFKIFKS